MTSRSRGGNDDDQGTPKPPVEFKGYGRKEPPAELPASHQIAEARVLAERVLRDPISDKTKDQYRRAVKRLVEAQQSPLDYCRQRGLGMSAYFRYKAAAQHFLAQNIMDAVKAEDKARKSGDTEGRAKAEKMILRAAAGLRHYDPDYDREHKPRKPGEHPGKACLYDGPSRRTQSKRRTLPRKVDWRPAVIEGVTDRHRDAARVQALTGCRPAELMMGVKIGANQVGDLVLEIPGAKVTGDAGQDWREVIVSADDPNAAELLKRGPSVVQVEKANSYQTAIRRAGEHAGFRGLSPYSFRHQLAADLKRRGVVPEQIAKALGHRTTKMQAEYGQAQQGQGGNKIKGVAAASAVSSNSRQGQGRKQKSSGPKPRR